MAKVFLTLFALVAVASAGPVTFDADAARACTCARNVYSAPSVAAAITQGRSLSGTSYPHTYSNFEGFTNFVCAGKSYIEFPVLTGGRLWNQGTSPGPDRVIYSPSGDFCGCITHTGAPSTNGFVSCTF